MRRRRSVLGTAAAVLLAGCGGSGTDGPTLESPGGLDVTSPVFEGAAIPVEDTDDGADRSPPVRVGGTPDDARRLALVADDPDAPPLPFSHWLFRNVPADRERLPAGIPQAARVASLGGAKQGTNDFDEVGYRGPAPSADDGPHTYRFTVYALESATGGSVGAGRGELEAAIGGSVLASGRPAGEYDR
jgi:Raf kinase inhibitor-like YbhB/YbcL family protein